MSHAAAWAILGFGLIGMEMVVPGAFLLWIGLAALGTALVAAWGELTTGTQVAIFVAWTVVLVATVAWRLRRTVRGGSVNAPAADLVGQPCRALLFQDGEGRVQLGDSTWTARVTGGEQPLPGQALRVVGLDGTVLLVSNKAEGANG